MYFSKYFINLQITLHALINNFVESFIKFSKRNNQTMTVSPLGMNAKLLQLLNATSAAKDCFSCYMYMLLTTTSGAKYRFSCLNPLQLLDTSSAAHY